uniref:Uncharacterized protein n=1 Tax=Panagrellus redivivus TaxID=6233 RepID=A0A7E4W7Q8_PANRE
MYSQLSQSPFPTGNFVVIRLPSGFASFHRVDDDIFADNSFEGISRRQTSRIPFTLFCLIVSKEVLVDCVARFGTLEDAELHKNKIQPPQTVFYPDPPSLPAVSCYKL